MRSVENESGIAKRGASLSPIIERICVESWGARVGRGKT